MNSLMLVVCGLVFGVGDARELPTVGVSFAFGTEFEEIVGNLPDPQGTAHEVASAAAASLAEHVGFLEFAPDHEFTPRTPRSSPHSYHLRITLRGPDEPVVSGDPVALAAADAEADAGQPVAAGQRAFFENHFQLELWDTRRQTPMPRPGTEETAYAIGYVKTELIRAHVRESALDRNLSAEFLTRLGNHRAQVVRQLFALVPLERRSHVFVTSRPDGNGGHKTRVVLPFSYDQLFVSPGTTFTLEDFTRNEDNEREQTRWASARATTMDELYDGDVQGGFENFSSKGVPGDFWALFPEPIILKDDAPASAPVEASTRPADSRDAASAQHVRGILDLQELPERYNGALEVWAIYVSDFEAGGRGLQRLQSQVRALPPNPFATSN